MSESAPLDGLATLTADDFEPHVGSIFSIATATAPIGLKLVRIRPLGHAVRAHGGFVLDFVANGPHLPQAIYALLHPAMGLQGIFLVPIGPVEGGYGYEAVFT